MVTEQNDRNYYFNLLRKHVLFETASNESISSLVANCNLKCLIKGENSIDKECTQYKFHFITKGKIKVFNLNSFDKHFTLFILSTNDVFDVFTLINNHQHNVCYEILENLELLVVPINYLRNWLKNNPSTLTSFFKYTIQKFELLESHILDLGTNNLTTRLANLLLQYYNFQTRQIEYINDLTHDELAQLIGTTRAVLNHHIQELKKAGIIKVSRKHIEILNLQSLADRGQHLDSYL